MGRLSGRPSGHGGSGVSMYRQKHGGEPYKQLFPQLDEGCAINAFIPINGEGQPSQVAALGLRRQRVHDREPYKRVLPLLHEECAINALSPRKMTNECPRPRDVNERCMNVRVDPINGRSRECL